MKLSHPAPACGALHSRNPPLIRVMAVMDALCLSRGFLDRLILRRTSAQPVASVARISCVRQHGILGRPEQSRVASCGNPGGLLKKARPSIREVARSIMNGRAGIQNGS